jgi:hypothetical protein
MLGTTALDDNVSDTDRREHPVSSCELSEICSVSDMCYHFYY